MIDPVGASWTRRLVRLARKGSLDEAGRTLRRASRRELTRRRIELDLARAVRKDSPIVVGPFLGEVGFELLYWIPMLRRLLGRRGVAPEQVTVVTRGGAALWYRDFAANAIDIFDLLPASGYRARLLDRWGRTGDAKQSTVEDLDRELIRRALERTGPAAVVHPILMFTRLRWIWQGAKPPREILRHADYRPLPAGERAAGLPDEYVVLKPYFSDCFPAGAATQEFLAELIAALAQESEVVLLSADLNLDDHEEWSGDELDRVHRVGARLEARDNLAVQTGIVAGARALLGTYGGFSYLGAFLDVPTVAFRSNGIGNPNHLQVLRAALPSARYEVVGAADPAAVARLAR